MGKLLIRDLEGQRLVGRITETEAYAGPTDKACHAYGGKRTPRTETLYAPPGTAYLYLVYGMYHCLNCVTEPEGTPCAVLLRSVVPIEGTNAMAQARFSCSEKDMTSRQRKNFLNGPGKICKAFSLDRSLNGADLTIGVSLWLADDGFRPFCIHSSPRIGIDYAEEAAQFPWRFFL